MFNGNTKLCANRETRGGTRKKDMKNVVTKLGCIGDADVILFLFICKQTNRDTQRYMNKC